MFARFGDGYGRTAAFAPRAFAGHAREGGGPGFSVAYRFSVLYGTITFLIAPLLGASTDRLVEYAWPLFLVALPWLLAQTAQLSGWKAATIFCLHLAASWGAWFAFRSYDTTAVFVAGVVALVFNCVAYFLLRRSAASREGLTFAEREV
jgi:hypothetical protein